jgi:hypothetical protein
MRGQGKCCAKSCLHSIPAKRPVVSCTTRARTKIVRRLIVSATCSSDSAPRIFHCSLALSRGEHERADLGGKNVSISNNRPLTVMNRAEPRCVMAERLMGRLMDCMSPERATLRAFIGWESRLL